jgi:hypothetical protein
MRMLSGGEGGRRWGPCLELKGEGEYTTNWKLMIRNVVEGRRRLEIQLDVQLGK